MRSTTVPSPHFLGATTPTRQSRRISHKAAAFRERSARRENEPGDFYVDHTCIDCDTCRWMQPEVYGRVNGMSAVVKQPIGDAERLRAAQALVACPTHSIHLQHKQGDEMKAALQSFPVQIEGASSLFHCGYHSESSYGAASYFIARPEGNILMDSPRFDPALLKRFKSMGGVRWMVLSHKDDVADHARWARELGCQRIIHFDETTRSQGTDACEIQLEGEGPWDLPEDSQHVKILFTPGHTDGHITLLYSKPGEEAMLTGDHLAFNSQNILTIFRRYNWYSIQEQLESVAKLRQHDFKIVLPGHGRPGHFDDVQHSKDSLNQLLSKEGFREPAFSHS